MATISTEQFPPPYNPYTGHEVMPTAPPGSPNSPGDPNRAKSSLARRVAAHLGGQLIGFIGQAITTVAVARLHGFRYGIPAGIAVNTIITPRAIKYLNEDTTPPKWYAQMSIGCVVNPAIGAVSGLSLFVGAIGSAFANPYAGIAFASLFARMSAYSTP